MLNDLLAQTGLLHWKPAVRTLLLPPMPLLLLLLAWLWWPRREPRRAGRALPTLVVLAIGLLGTPVVGAWLQRTLTQPPPPLSAVQRQALVGAEHTAIPVLGAGRETVAPEYDGQPDLKPGTLARLRYGAWLARELKLPLGFSGGVGFGAAPGPGEAQVAARVARQELGVPLRWQEGRSRDTRENARYSIEMLRRDGIRRVLLVTHATHQRRALAGFERELAAQGQVMQLLPAPMGQAQGDPRAPGDWIPTPAGLLASWTAVYEWLGRLGGA